MLKLFVTLLIVLTTQGRIFIPVRSADRRDLSTIELTEIGQFGLLRKARANIPEHLHTGIDIKRPNDNYDSEPIFPVAEGIVISRRTDGPFANLIIEHTINGIRFWSVYEHIAGVNVNISQKVKPETPIARFMNKTELNQYGWQFDHFHLEILRVKPIRINPVTTTPERFFNSHTLRCHDRTELENYFYNPIEFFKMKRFNQ